ncbi:MAG: PEP-CTERM sorting domain-containing protein [Planctomycetota bacterium]
MKVNPKRVLRQRANVPGCVSFLVITLLFSYGNQRVKAGILEATLAGEITTIDSEVKTPIDLGDPFRFVYRFDSEEPDQLPNDQTFGVYQILSATLQIGPYSIDLPGSGPESNIKVQTFHPFKEQYFVRADFPESFVGLANPIAVGLLDRWPEHDWLFTNDSLPTVLNIHDFAYTQFSLEAFDSSSDPPIQGTIDFAEIRPIPEPSPLVLSAVGAVAWLLTRRHNRRLPCPSTCKSCAQGIMRNRKV